MYSAKNVCHGFQNREQKVLWVNVIVKNLNINNMEDFEITKEGIVIIQWLNNLDPRLGEELYTNIKNKESERDNYFVEFHNVEKKEEFISVMTDLISKTTKGTLFTLHIVAHGYENGIGLNVTNSILWKELFEFTRELNIKMGNNLLLVLSSCVGGGVLSFIEPEKRAPYRAIIANTREVFMTDASCGFTAFYSKFYNISDFKLALEALNKAIDFSVEIEPGKKKTEFFIMTAENSFNEIFNPERDPVFFEEMVNKLMPPNSEIPQELRLEKVKKILKERGEKLKPYFTFLD